jgi:hypothetical protein
VARILPPVPSGGRQLGLPRGRIEMAADFDATEAAVIAAMEGDDKAARRGCC